MEIKAKFRCSSIVDTDYGGTVSVRQVAFAAVYGTKGENASYAKATPWGELKIQLDKETIAHDHFKVGKEYYLTIEDAEKIA